ncbi:cyclin-like protein interacting with PHO85 [Purpureocillium takamizusanense]|uniref:Cyclin-like protein interacting with PHO85 n=1 Tax=Purpureocillium takamizusanense TaxID=2060973 RepID=A0A9Q8QSM7_9HYPO|nr:cyclin-like protein interacting with PHO85 [Purpureocillium takamizusanense]UNI25050.1 cyclin-like protein interacting with PHO85 [Purpureocillium takamizusanense]
MAAVVGELVSDLSRFHDMIVTPSSTLHQQAQHQHRRPSSPSVSPRPSSRSRSSHRPAHATASTTSPSPRRPAHCTQSSARTVPGRHRQREPSAAPSPASVVADSLHSETTRITTDDVAATTTAARKRGYGPSTTGDSRIPSPPPSSSPAVAAGPAEADDAKTASMASQLGDRVSDPRSALPPDTADMSAPAQRQQPSPPDDGLQAPYTPAPYLVSTAAAAPQQTVVHVRDLAHIQTLAGANVLGGTGASAAGDAPIRYEISGMPISDIIEMVAALLTKITSTNDLQHDAMQRNVAHQQQANQNSDNAGGSQMSPLSHSVLAFHGKNVPAITILSYLSRIHKYCPTTYEVFLSLLVYFDRMTERVNDMVMKTEEARRQPMSRPASSHQPTTQHDTAMRDDPPAARGSDESDSDLADDDDDDDMVDSPTSSARREASRIITVPDEQAPAIGPATYFVVDSFNIHRLIIAGVTCASKFFSDVFYTNSRYAKVGGLPLAELNHLEIQFLVLNDFRLAVPVEDLEAYATMLVEFYAREVVAHKTAPEPAS